MRPWLLAAGLALSPPLFAETAYVTDELRLGVHAQADTSDAPFTNLLSGDEVTVLERQGPYARVRLADDREGWARAAFLTPDAPARHRLPLVTAERDELAAQLAAGAAQAAAGEALAARAARAEAELQASRAALAELRDRQAATAAAATESLHRVPYTWALAAGGLGLLAGLMLMWWWQDWRSRRRHGGFRVY